MPPATAKQRLTGVGRAFRAASIFLGETGAFRLALALFGHPVRLDHWLTRLAQEVAKANVHLTRCRIPAAGDPRLLEELTAHLRDVPTLPGHTRAVVVTGISSHLPDAAAPHHPGDPAPPFLATANLDRELLPGRCPHPLLLCLTPTAYGRFRRHAPDLAHWCSYTFDFSEPALPDGSQHIRSISELQQARAGTTYSNRDEMLCAADIFRAGLNAATAAHGPAHRETLGVRANLANVLHQLGRSREALELAEENQRMMEITEGIPDAERANRCIQLASFLAALGRLVEAEPLIRQALSIDEAVFGTDHPEVATPLNNLARLLQDTNRLTEAETLMRRALAIDEAALGKDHPNVASRLNNLALLLQDTNRHTEAEPLMRRALAIGEAALGKDHPSVATRLNNLAQLLQNTNRLTEAEPLMRRALAIDEAVLGTDHPRVAIRLNNLASLLRATNRLDEAEPLMRRTLGIVLRFTRDTGHRHPHLDDAVGGYRLLLKETGRTEEQADEEISALAAEYGVTV